MFKLVDFLKDNFEKNSYTVDFFDVIEDFVGDYGVLEFQKNSKQYALNFYENATKSTKEVVKWGKIHPELEEEFLVVKETLSSNEIVLDIYGSFEDYIGLILRFRYGPIFYDLILAFADPK
ncbi:MAG: hypothetical protein KGD59_11465 [Candidatus Heimdallarchaeota archaeon]|nr:hypothetical protein [Candidatus Heimdallarchaeota archaeon]MBY8995161.1 hypothetical protein [Candidatus Heimdallarchaeota archaeon]